MSEYGFQQDDGPPPTSPYHGQPLLWDDGSPVILVVDDERPWLVYAADRAEQIARARMAGMVALANQIHQKVRQGAHQMSSALTGRVLRAGGLLAPRDPIGGPPRLPPQRRSAPLPRGGIAVEVPDSDNQGQAGGVVWPELSIEEKAHDEERARRDVLLWENDWRAVVSGLRPSDRTRKLGDLFGIGTPRHTSSAVAVTTPQSAEWPLSVTGSEKRQQVRQSYRDALEWMQPFFEAGLGAHDYHQIMAYEEAARRAEAPDFEEWRALILKAKHMFLGALTLLSCGANPDGS